MAYSSFLFLDQYPNSPTYLRTGLGSYWRQWRKPSWCTWRQWTQFLSRRVCAVWNLISKTMSAGLLFSFFFFSEITNSVYASKGLGSTEWLTRPSTTKKSEKPWCTVSGAKIRSVRLSGPSHRARVPSGIRINTRKYKSSSFVFP